MAENPLRLITQEQSWLTEVHEDVVSVLEKALKRAKSGELTGIAIAATTKDDCTWTTFSKRAASGMLLGAIARLNYRLNQADE